MENNLGKNIKKLRKALNKSQKEFAQPLGIKHGTVSDYEKGKTKPSESIFELIEIKYSVNRKSLEAEDYSYRVESPKSDWNKHGGWKRTLKRAGITRRIRPYDLRHNFITLALEDGADMKALSEIVGSRPETIMRHYQHVSRKLHRKTVAKIPPLAGDTYPQK